MNEDADQVFPPEARRVLLVSTCRIADLLRGAEQQAVLLASGLKRRGWEVLMAVPEGTPVQRAARAADIPCFPLDVRPEFSPFAFWRLHRHARAFRPAILHLNDPHAVSMGGYARLFGSAPMVLAHRRMAKTPKSILAYRMGAQGVIAISEAVRRNIVAAGYPAEQTALAYSCVDPRYLAATMDRDEARARLRVPPSAFVFTMAAAMVRNKNHTTVLNAFRAFQGREDVLLVLVGDGPERPAIEDLSRRAGLSAQVRFTGTLQGDDLIGAYRASDVFVYATNREGLGIAALEAQAMGLPVVGSRVVGLTEAVCEGRTGLLVEPQDVKGLAEAMERLRLDSDLRRQLGEAGPAWVRERFSDDAMVRGVLAAYALFRTRRTRALPA